LRKETVRTMQLLGVRRIEELEGRVRLRDH